MKKLIILSAMMMVFQVCSANGDAKRGKLIYGRIKAEELKASKTKQGNCLQCHGKMGMGKAKKGADGKYKLNMMKGPRIAGLDEAYIVEQLKAVKSKTRKTKYTSTMFTRVNKYKEQDMKDLAAYISKALNPDAGSYKSEIWPREK